MTILTDDIKTQIEESVLCWLATVDAEGTPNVSPKEMFHALDDSHILIANIASPNSVRNIRTNPKVCISFIDVFKQQGAKLTGHANILEKDSTEFGKIGTKLLKMAGPDFPIKSIIKVTVERTAKIIAPSYYLKPDVSDEYRMAGVFENYGVKPV